MSYSSESFVFSLVTSSMASLLALGVWVRGTQFTLSPHLALRLCVLVAYLPQQVVGSWRAGLSYSA